MKEKLPESEPREKEQGSIEVICGCMFSGKSEELIKRLKRTKYARIKAQAFKPVVDDRRGEASINSYNGVSYPAIGVSNSLEILDLVEEETKVVGIDECQFFDNGLTDVVRKLAAQGKQVLVAGLDTDFRGEPFGPMPDLLVEADGVDKQKAFCVRCGAKATRTQRIKIVDGERIPARYDDPLVLIGAENDYEARCREHHEVPGKPGSK